MGLGAAVTLGEIESKSWGSVGHSMDRIPRSLFPPKTALCCIKAKGHFVSGARGLRNSQFVPPPSTPTPYGSAGKGGGIGPICSAANGIRSVWESWREMQIIADGRSRTGKRSIGGGGGEWAACAAPRASFDRWNGLVQSIFATRRSHLGQYVLLSALISHLHVLLDC